MLLSPRRFTLTLLLLLAATPLLAADSPSDGALKGSHDYDEFEEAASCKQCHLDIYRQWEQSMMSQAYTHKWDEVEYFELAVAHAENDPNVDAAVHEGCNGCHTPMAFLAGDVPPPRPGQSRADESVSCEVCHLIDGRAEGTPFNFSWTIKPGDEKRANRSADEAAASPRHKMVKSDIHAEAEFCGTCHNEKSPFGAWVKATQIEWAEGPYAEEGVVCHDCHMTYAPGRSAKMGKQHEDVRQHLFHGAHDPGKLNGVVELRLHPDQREVVMGTPLQLSLALFNQKTGHKFPTGSVEDRIVWVHVEVTDSEGNVFPLPVDKKGFEGEKWTIASDELAYADMAVPLDDPDFEGVRREDVPIGDRIFRMPYFDPDGGMTIMQWNTASFGPDYRIGPRETKLETYTWELPFDAAPGPATATATMYYRKLVKPVAELLDVAEEAKTETINSHSTEFTILP